MLSCIFDQKRSNLLWYGLLRSKMWFSLSDLCVKSYAVTIQMKAISGSFLWLLAVQGSWSVQKSEKSERAVK